MAQLTERPADWPSTAPIVVNYSRRIAAPVETVWQRIVDHETWTEWMTDLSSVTVTLGAEGVGGGRDAKANGMTVKERFTAWDPPHQFGFTVYEGPRVLTSMAETIDLEADGDGCKINYTIGLEPAKGFGWLVKQMAKRLGASQRKAIDTLAGLVE